MGKQQENSKEQFPILVPLYNVKSENGNLLSVKFNSKTFDALTKMELGGRFLISFIKEEYKKEGRAEVAYLKILPPSDLDAKPTKAKASSKPKQTEEDIDI